MPLPPPRHDQATYSIALVCLGNICRSAMAEAVLRHKLQEAGLDDMVEVRSSGTGDWHVGEPMDDRAAATLARHGYDPSKHRAEQFDATWFAAHDVVLVMDSGNLHEVTALASSQADRDRVQMFRTYDPDAATDLDVPDPWFGGQDGFDAVLATVERTTDVLVAELAAAVRAPDVR
jgi:protein-tyrosine phosphatase